MTFFLPWFWAGIVGPVLTRWRPFWVLGVRPPADGCRVDVHHEAQDDAQAQYLTAAWSMVLGKERH